MTTRTKLLTTNSYSEAEAFNLLLGRELYVFLRRCLVELGVDDFEHTWHIPAMLHQLEEVRLGAILRHIINIQPRSLKSTIVSVVFVAWCWGHDPSLKFLCISYAQDLSSEFARQCRQIMQSPWYRALFPNTVLSGLATQRLTTTAGGRRISTSMQGKITGYGADYILLDDPQSAQAAQSPAERARTIETFRTSVASRLNKKKTGRILLVMQRLHEEDLSGWLLEQGGWGQMRFPTIADRDELIPLGNGRVHRRKIGDLLQPHREPQSVIDEQRRLLGIAGYSAQLLQTPLPAAGLIIQRNWVKRYQKVPSEGRIFMAIDTAGKNAATSDYTAFVIAMVVGRDVYVIDVIRERLNYPEIKARTIGLCRRYRVFRLLIEDASSGQSLIQDLDVERPYGVSTPIALKATSDKHTRVSDASSLVEEGHLHLPGFDAPWLPETESEMFGFPNTRHDDIIDALAHLLIDVKSRSVRHVAPAELLRDSPWRTGTSRRSGPVYNENGAEDCTDEDGCLRGRWY